MHRKPLPEVRIRRLGCARVASINGALDDEACSHAPSSVPDDAVCSLDDGVRGVHRLLHCRRQTWGTEARRQWVTEARDERVWGQEALFGGGVMVDGVGAARTHQYHKDQIA
jgi:hypothetical protein